VKDEHPIFKLVSMWATWGLAHAQVISTLLAALYTMLLVFDWFWRRFWRPFLVSRGWWNPRSPYLADSGNVPLDISGDKK